MTILLLLGQIAGPLILFALRRRKVAVLFDLLAAVALLLANMSAGMAVLEIKRHHSEFTTQVHQIFIDPIFLLSIGYIAVYAVYRLLVTTSHSWQNRLPHP